MSKGACGDRNKQSALCSMMGWDVKGKDVSIKPHVWHVCETLCPERQTASGQHYQMQQTWFFFFVFFWWPLTPKMLKTWS